MYRLTSHHDSVTDLCVLEHNDNNLNSIDSNNNNIDNNEHIPVEDNNTTNTNRSRNSNAYLYDIYSASYDKTIQRNLLDLHVQ